MLDVSLRRVNFGFWSHLGRTAKYNSVLPRKGLFKFCARRNVKKYILFFQFALFTRFTYSKFKMASFRG